MYIDNVITKKHLNIDESWVEDDEYIKALCKAAECAVENHIQRPLSEIADVSTGKLPAAVNHAILLLVGHFYANRESVSFAAGSTVPLAYEYLLQPYKSYAFDTSFGV